MRFNLFVSGTNTYRARFRGSVVKFSNNLYATYYTPGIGTFAVLILYIEFGSAYIIAKGRGIAS